jgi:hypothetical protein
LAGGIDLHRKKNSKSACTRQGDSELGELDLIEVERQDIEGSKRGVAVGFGWRLFLTDNWKAGLKA